MLWRELKELKMNIKNRKTEAREKEARSRELELILDGIRGKIKKHRKEKAGFCWYFGQGGVEADYSSAWDDPGYWRLLLTLDSNCGETLLRMNYRQMEM